MTASRAFFAADAPALLALNAAEGSIQCLVARRNNQECWQQCCFEEWLVPSQGAELLTPLLEKTMAALGIRPAHITHLAGVQGPGSFTGLRLVLATLSGIAQVTGAVQGGVPYLPLLASQAARVATEWSTCLRHIGIATFAPEVSPLFWVGTHARRNLLHLQGFAATIPNEAQASVASGLHAVTDIVVVTLEEAAGFIVQFGQPALLLGSGMSGNRDILHQYLHTAGASFFFLPRTYSTPSAQMLLEAAIAATYTQEDIPPLYVRGSDAEENLAHIAQGLGLAADQAEAALQKLTSR